eukprot:4614428-Alexandrium_andersonii.AAC.1
MLPHRRRLRLHRLRPCWRIAVAPGRGPPPGPVVASARAPACHRRPLERAAAEARAARRTRAPARRSLQLLP